jgi:hypothetical protein
MKDKFHTRVANLLYLAKRVRPDTLVTTVFLTTRVLRPNEEDLSKFNRVVRYLRNTKHLNIILEPRDVINIIAYIVPTC